MVFSQFANNLKCAYCMKSCAASEWPAHGDYVPFYNQTKERTEEEPGAFSVPVHCPHCMKDWYIVWDQDPR